MTIGEILQASAAQMFALHGYEVTLSRPTATDNATYDVSTGTMTGGDSTPDWTGKGFYADFMSEEIDGTTIQVGDRKLLLQAQGLTQAPKIGDIVDSELKVIDVKRVRSGATVTHYVCPVRG